MNEDELRLEIIRSVLQWLHPEDGATAVKDAETILAFVSPPAKDHPETKEPVEATGEPVGETTVRVGGKGN